MLGIDLNTIVRSCTTVCTWFILTECRLNEIKYMYVIYARSYSGGSGGPKRRRHSCWGARLVSGLLPEVYLSAWAVACLAQLKWLSLGEISLREGPSATERMTNFGVTVLGGGGLNRLGGAAAARLVV